MYQNDTPLFTLALSVALVRPIHTHFLKVGIIFAYIIREDKERRINVRNLRFNTLKLNGTTLMKRVGHRTKENQLNRR